MAPNCTCSNLLFHGCETLRHFLRCEESSSSVEKSFPPVTWQTCHFHAGLSLNVLLRPNHPVSIGVRFILPQILTVHPSFILTCAHLSSRLCGSYLQRSALILTNPLLVPGCVAAPPDLHG